MGCDCDYLRQSDCPRSFNPRTRMGCDFSRHRLAVGRQCFNPRTRMGCDVYIVDGDIVMKVSIHAPAWGAT